MQALRSVHVLISTIDFFCKRAYAAFDAVAMHAAAAAAKEQQNSRTAEQQSSPAQELIAQNIASVTQKLCTAHTCHQAVRPAEVLSDLGDLSCRQRLPHLHCNACTCVCVKPSAFVHTG